MEIKAAYWFRNDLRLEDNPSFLSACSSTNCLLPIYCHPPQATLTQWGFERIGAHRQFFLRDCISNLKQNLNAYGSSLIELDADAADGCDEIRLLIETLTSMDINTVYCEAIAAPQEREQIDVLIKAGFTVHSVMQSTMIDLDSLPFTVEQMPNQFTQFRQRIEKAKYRFTEPLASPFTIPPLPSKYDRISLGDASTSKQASGSNQAALALRGESSFPYWEPLYCGGESAALAHLTQYLDRALPDSYKQTRNQLFGIDYSSKFSPWLAYGCISARTIASRLQHFEERHGATEGSYWLWFELVWRDYFRVLHLKWGRQLYAAKGLSSARRPNHHPHAFERWCSGNTGESIVDAGMRELSLTGYLSNRLRQVVASYLIYDLDCDWRAGAAWFESQLIDYDVYSNQGNWLYIAGRGTDPRGGRRFNPQKQALDHDPNGIYRAMWLSR